MVASPSAFGLCSDAVLWIRAVRARVSRAVLCVLMGSLGLCQTGCGYAFVRPSQGVAGAHTVAVEGFANETIQPGLDSLMTGALRRELARRGALRLVRDPRAADLVISGTVAAVSTSSRSFSSVQFALEYEVRVSLTARVQRRDGATIKLGPRVLSASDRYLSSADVEISRTYREEALRRVTDVLAGRIADALLASQAP